MLYPMLAIVIGLVVLVWSADRFVDSAACTAKQFKLSPLLIGIVIIGFSTCAPELMMSALALSCYALYTLWLLRSVFVTA
jgi:cation:H+ antiporter